MQKAERVGLSLSMLGEAPVEMHSILGCRQVLVPCPGEPPHGFHRISQITMGCR